MVQRTHIPILLLICLGMFLSSCSGYRSTLSPRIAITEEYTDNVALSSSNPESALISTVSPGLTYALTGHNETMSLRYDPSFAYYCDNRRLSGHRPIR